MQRLKRIAWTSLALAFLAVSWLWDVLHPLISALIVLLPLDGLKQAVKRFMDRLPPYPTLFIFLVPLVASEPIKIFSYWLFAKREWWAGVVTYGFAELLRFGLVAFLFNTCKDKLLSIPWFARLYLWFVRIHSWAHDQVAPMRAALRRIFAEAGIAPGSGSFFRRAGALWRHTRRRRALGS